MANQGVFADVKIGWADADYVIPANRVMGLIHVIEDVPGATLTELSVVARDRGTVKVGVLAAAWAAVLNYAGVVVLEDGRPRPISEEEVYAAMFPGNKGPSARDVQESLFQLIAIQIPPDVLVDDVIDDAGGDAAAKKAKPTARRGSSSKKRTNSRSASRA